MSLLHFIIFINFLLNSTLSYRTPVYNGDIYLVSEDKFLQNRKNSLTNSADVSVTMKAADTVDFDDVIEECNSSFSIPTVYLTSFNSTGSLPDVTDKTGMCFLRCFYEKSGFIKNWKLSDAKIRKYMWPATGDSIEICEQEKSKETNSCVRLYAIIKCLMLRAIVDARNKPV